MSIKLEVLWLSYFEKIATDKRTDRRTGATLNAAA